MAIPSKLPQREVLDLASLVLSGREYQELCHEIGAGPAAQPDTAATRTPPADPRHG